MNAIDLSPLLAEVLDPREVWPAGEVDAGGFGEVAGDEVAFVDEPLGVAGGFGGPGGG